MGSLPDESALTPALGTSVSVVIDGARCRAGNTTHCHANPVRVRMGGWATNIVIDPSAGTSICRGTWTGKSNGSIPPPAEPRRAGGQGAEPGRGPGSAV